MFNSLSSKLYRQCPKEGTNVSKCVGDAEYKNCLCISQIAVGKYRTQNRKKLRHKIEGVQNCSRKTFVKSQAIS